MRITDERLEKIAELFGRKYLIENGGVAEVTAKEVIEMATELLQWRLVHQDPKVWEEQ